MSGSHGEDRRVRRTKGRLRGAIAALAFSLPFLQHVARARAVDGSVSSPERFAPVHACLRRVLADHVLGALRGVSRGRLTPAHAVPDDLLAEHVAETFLRVLTWWVRHAAPRGPAHADAVFLALARPALAAWFDD